MRLVAHKAKNFYNYRNYDKNRLKLTTRQSGSSLVFIKLNATLVGC